MGTASTIASSGTDQVSGITRGARCRAPLSKQSIAYVPDSHFFMKLFFAAPASGLPSELTAFVAHESAMHFFMNDVFAAPASALPSLPTALLSQDSCAKAEPIASVAITEARTMLLTMGVLPTSWNPNLSAERSGDQVPSAIQTRRSQSSKGQTPGSFSLSVDERVT